MPIPVETDPNEEISYNNRIPLTEGSPYIIRRKRSDDVHTSFPDLPKAKYVLVDHTGEVVDCGLTIKEMIATCLPDNNWPFVFDVEAASDLFDLL
jgi:hypothetical protein